LEFSSKEFSAKIVVIMRIRNVQSVFQEIAQVKCRQEEAMELHLKAHWIMMTGTGMKVMKMEEALIPLTLMSLQLLPPATLTLIWLLKLLTVTFQFSD
jgi:hypothetical protein